MTSYEKTHREILIEEGFMGKKRLEALLYNTVGTSSSVNLMNLGVKLCVKLYFINHSMHQRCTLACDED